MKRTHHLFLLTLAVSVTILVIAVYFYMQYAVKVSATRVIAARDIVTLEKSGKEHEQEIRSLYENTIDKRARLPGFLIPSDRVVDFIESLEALGRQSGSEVTITAIDADIPEKGDTQRFGTARARVEANGSWSSVMRTLSLAENLPYAVYINSVRLDLSGPAEKSSRSWRLNFAIEAMMSSVTASSSPSKN